MKTMLLIILASIGLTGCASLGPILQGMGNGMQGGARSTASSTFQNESFTYNNQAVNCQSVKVGNYVSTNCY